MVEIIRHEFRGVLRNTTIRINKEANQHPSISGWLSHKAAHQTVMLAYAGAADANWCYVRFTQSGEASIWIGPASFELPVSEAERAALLLGIRVEDERQQGGAA